MSQPVATLVGDLYGCLLHEKPETRALDVLCSAVGARHAFIMRVGQASGCSMATSHHLTSCNLAGLDDIGRSVEYAQVLANVAAGSFSRLTDLLSRQQLRRSEIYQQALRPLDGGLAACGYRFDGGDLVVSAVCRSLSSDADFDDEAIATLSMTLPHLVAVTALAGRMEHERGVGESAFDALDITPDGVIILGPRGAVIHVNAAAEAMLARGDRLERSHDGIVASDPSDNRKLQQAIETARLIQEGRTLYGQHEDATPSCRIVLGKSRRGWPLVVTVLQARQAILGGCAGRNIMLHLVDSGSSVCLPTRILRDEFGLTVREAELTQQLALGATLSESARHLDISLGTARQYLKIVFHKVGVNSQANLLRIVRH